MAIRKQQVMEVFSSLAMQLRIGGPSSPERSGFIGEGWRNRSQSKQKDSQAREHTLFGGPPSRFMTEKEVRPSWNAPLLSELWQCDGPVWPRLGCHVYRAVDLSEIVGVDGNVAARTTDGRAFHLGAISQTNDVGAHADGAAASTTVRTGADEASIDANPFRCLDDNVAAPLTD